jgi:hypothetical protein
MLSLVAYGAWFVTRSVVHLLEPPERFCLIGSLDQNGHWQISELAFLPMPGRRLGITIIPLELLHGPWIPLECCSPFRHLGSSVLVPVQQVIFGPKGKLC